MWEQEKTRESGEPRIGHLRQAVARAQTRSHLGEWCRKEEPVHDVARPPSTACSTGRPHPSLPLSSAQLSAALCACVRASVCICLSPSLPPQLQATPPPASANLCDAATRMMTSGQVRQGGARCGPTQTVAPAWGSPPLHPSWRPPPAATRCDTSIFLQLSPRETSHGNGDEGVCPPREAAMQAKPEGEKRRGVGRTTGGRLRDLPVCVLAP